MDGYNCNILFHYYEKDLEDEYLERMQENGLPNNIYGQRTNETTSNSSRNEKS